MLLYVASGYWQQMEATMQKHILACPDARATEAWQLGTAGVPGAGAALSAHPAYPSARDLRIEARVDRILVADAAAAETMRSALQAAIDAIAPLRFATGCPSFGYDLEDVLDQLRDMLPVTLDATVAYEIAVQAEDDADADAAEARALRRKDA